MTRLIDLDCEREDDISVTIRELREHIAHLETYTDTDVGLLKRRLDVLEQQQKTQHKGG